MTFEQIEALMMTRLTEAAKVLHMDASHSALREQIQKRLTADHRVNNPESDYYGYPYVQDMYGDGESGTVVHSTQGKHTMSKYKKGKDGSYTLSDHKKVKPAYVTVANDAEEQKESFLFVDGEESPLSSKESALDTEELVELRESCFDANGVGIIKMIGPGQGSTAYYSPEVLKEAVKKGVFNDAQMFIDHATDEEEANRPEGSVHGLAAKGSRASYQENGPDGPGVYTRATAYPDVAPFLNARAKDIGVSIRAMGTKVLGQIGGKVTKIAKSIDVMKSTDFVTKAGAGGKLIPLLESFRESHRATEQSRQQAAKEKQVKVEIEDTELATLRESAASVSKLQLSVDRNNEKFNRIDAKDLTVIYLQESALPKPAQARLLKMVTANHYTLPITTEGSLDTVKFNEALKALVADEAAYLKESGVVRIPLHLGDSNEPEDKEAETKLKESVAKEDTEFSSIIGGLSGVKKEKK